MIQSIYAMCIDQISRIGLSILSDICHVLCSEPANACLLAPDSGVTRGRRQSPHCAIISFSLECIIESSTVPHPLPCEASFYDMLLGYVFRTQL